MMQRQRPPSVALPNKALNLDLLAAVVRSRRPFADHR